jgi:cysteinyl-tRNA synthetase
LTATPDVATLDAFRAAMNDDLNTPVAMGVLFDAVRRANVAVDSGETQTAASVSSAVREMCIAIGLQLDVAKEVDADAQTLATALDKARAAKDFATADKLRAELQALGYFVETTKAGTTLRRA